jgi:hypothetical protein
VFVTGHVVVHVFDGSPLMAVAVNAWYRSALVFVFGVPVGVAAAYYLAPKVIGRPVYSYSLGILGFWARAVAGLPGRAAGGEPHGRVRPDDGRLAAACRALAASIREHWAAHGRGEHLVMSFHGVPRRYLDAGDPYHCLCHATGFQLAQALGLEEGVGVGGGHGAAGSCRQSLDAAGSGERG